jgi:ankyrin repeat protein
MMAWVIVAALHIVRDRLWPGRWPVVVAVTAIWLALPYLPEGSLEYATVRCLGPGRHAVEILVSAAEADNQRTVRYLLSAGVDINANATDGRTAVMAAAGTSQSEFLAWLLDHGASVNVQDDLGLSPLVEAIVSQRADNVRLLIGRGADVRRPFQGQSMLELAHAKGTPEIAHVIQDAIDR